MLRWLVSIVVESTLFWEVNYANILWNNIESRREHNFQTYGQQGQDGDEYSSFDINSIMMYGPYFAGVSSANGANIVQWQYVGGQNQQFWIFNDY